LNLSGAVAAATCLARTQFFFQHHTTPQLSRTIAHQPTITDPVATGKVRLQYTRPRPRPRRRGVCLHFRRGTWWVRLQLQVQHSRVRQSERNLSASSYFLSSTNVIPSPSVSTTIKPHRTNRPITAPTTQRPPTHEPRLDCGRIASRSVALALAPADLRNHRHPV
jgi:hypothetical protein